MCPSMIKILYVAPKVQVQNVLQDSGPKRDFHYTTQGQAQNIFEDSGPKMDFHYLMDRCTLSIVHPLNPYVYTNCNS